MRAIAVGMAVFVVVAVAAAAMHAVMFLSALVKPVFAFVRMLE